MKNLVKLYSTVNPSTIKDGLTWYNEANKYCNVLAIQYNKPIDVVCAILSALSPATNYEQNKKDTLNLLAGTKGYRCSTYGSNVSKARLIVSGKLSPANAFSLKTGPKTYNFYRNVLHPDSNEYCTIDRHAYAIVTDDTHIHLTPKRYELIAGHYKRAANKLGIKPCQLQAVLWVDYRNKQNISFKKFDNVDCPF